jgi:hypothetical protein
MAGRLQLDRAPKNSCHFVESISSPRTKSSAYIEFIVIEQVKRSGAGIPQAVKRRAFTYASIR